MATKKIRLPITIGIPDPEKSKPLILDKEGRQVQAAETVVKYVPPGTPVELDADVAAEYLARFGPYTETVVVTDGEAGPAPASIPASSVRR